MILTRAHRIININGKYLTYTAIFQFYEIVQVLSTFVLGRECELKHTRVCVCVSVWGDSVNKDECEIINIINYEYSWLGMPSKKKLRR